MVQGNRSADYKAGTEPDSKGILEAGTTIQSRGQRKPTDGLASQHGAANAGPLEASQRKASRRQFGTPDGSNNWNAALLRGWGYVGVKLVVDRSTSRSKEGTTTKGKYAKGQEKFNTNKKLGNSPRKTKRNNAESIHVLTNRIRRGGKGTTGNLDMVRIPHGPSVCTKRGQATSSVEARSKTTKANIRRTVEK